MPIYEYLCRDCDSKFELIVRDATPPRCPSCAGVQLEKQLSVFAVGAATATHGPAVPAGACGTCGDPRGPGACSIN